MEDWIAAQSLCKLCDTEPSELVTFIMALGAVESTQNQDMSGKFNTSEHTNEQPATITAVLMCINFCAWDTSVMS